MAVRLLSQGERGLAAALNRGCDEARSDLVLLLLAGDLLAPGCAAAAAKALGATTEAVACAVRWTWLDKGWNALPGALATPNWNSPALGCETAAACGGGFVGAPGGTSVLPPPGMRITTTDGADTLAWRPVETIDPWRAGTPGDTLWAIREAAA
jgi:hypothetical protein